MKTLYRSTGLILFFSVVIAFVGCGKKAEEPATAEETGAVTEAPVPETPAEDVAGIFQAKVAEVDAYMTAHDVKNTPRDKMAAQLEIFQKDFEDLQAKAAGDDELAGRCSLAAEGMSLYVKSLRMPPDDLEQMQVAIDAEVKWTQAKEGLTAEPQT